MKVFASLLASLLAAAGVFAQSQAPQTANSCQLVSALDTAGRITFRDGSYVTRKPSDRAGVLVQEQYGSTGRLRYRAEVSRRASTDTIELFDPKTFETTIKTVEGDGYANAGAYTCYEIDGRGYATGEHYADDRERETPYRQVLPNGTTGITGSFRGRDSVGTWRINDEQGRLVEEITFRDGKRFGPYRQLDADGAVQREGQYFRGEALDTVIVFDPVTYETNTRLIPLGSSPCGTWKVRGEDGALKEEEYAPCLN